MGAIQLTEHEALWAIISISIVEILWVSVIQSWIDDYNFISEKNSMSISCMSIPILWALLAYVNIYIDSTDGSIAAITSLVVIMQLDLLCWALVQEPIGMAMQAGQSTGIIVTSIATLSVYYKSDSRKRLSALIYAIFIWSCESLAIVGVFVLLLSLFFLSSDDMVRGYGAKIKRILTGNDKMSEIVDDLNNSMAQIRTAGNINKIRSESARDGVIVVVTLIGYMTNTALIILMGISASEVNGLARVAVAMNTVSYTYAFFLTILNVIISSNREITCEHLKACFMPSTFKVYVNKKAKDKGDKLKKLFDEITFVISRRENIDDLISMQTSVESCVVMLIRCYDVLKIIALSENDEDDSEILNIVYDNIPETGIDVKSMSLSPFLDSEDDSKSNRNKDLFGIAVAEINRLCNNEKTIQRLSSSSSNNAFCMIHILILAKQVLAKLGKEKFSDRNDLAKLSCINKVSSKGAMTAINLPQNV